MDKKRKQFSVGLRKVPKNFDELLELKAEVDTWAKWLAEAIRYHQASKSMANIRAMYSEYETAKVLLGWKKR